MQFTIKHRFKTDGETFWDKIFFDEAYNRALFLDHLSFSVFKLIEFNRTPDGAISRKLELAPKVEIPRAIKKVLGSTVNYVEQGTFDPQTQSWLFDVIPQVGAQKIKSHGKLWLEPRGDKEIDRICLIDTEVKIFGIGRMVQELIEKQTRTSYDQAAVFTHKWIEDKGL